jgi:hypothetical protein
MHFCFRLGRNPCRRLNMFRTGQKPMSSAINLLTRNSFRSVEVCVWFAGIVSPTIIVITSIVTKSFLTYVPTQITFRWPELIPPALRMSPHIPVLRYKFCKIARLLFSLLCWKITWTQFILLLLEKRRHFSFPISQTFRCCRSCYTKHVIPQPPDVEQELSLNRINYKRTSSSQNTSVWGGEEEDHWNARSWSN